MGVWKKFKFKTKPEASAFKKGAMVSGSSTTTPTKKLGNWVVEVKL